MTPDERAERAERVIEETIGQFHAFAAWFFDDAARVGTTAAIVMRYAAETLERNARIAGIPAKAPKAGS